MLLSPLSRIYGSVLETRARLYHSGALASRTLGRPTVAIGNLTLGGTGKTPFTGWLATRFRFEGRRPAILSRGYGRRSRGALVVSDGSGPRVGPEEGGDEPVMLARRLPGIIVAVAERRGDAARLAADLGADLFLLDDAYQHLAVARDVNLLLLDARDPFGGGELPPAGRLREPLSALGRADAFVFTRVDHGEPSAFARGSLAAARPDAPVFTARIRAAGIGDESGASLSIASAGERRLLAVCGVASPRAFSSSLAELGLLPEETLVFRDHQRYEKRQIDRIRRAAERTGSSWIVTTEKDAVKLGGKLPYPVLAVRLEVDVREPGFFSFLDSRLRAAAPGEERER